VRNRSLHAHPNADFFFFCLFVFIRIGQVVALFIVGSCEYGVVWLCTDWEYEVERGVRRNNPEMLQVSGVSA
jgi:hypothetical protein